MKALFALILAAGSLTAAGAIALRLWIDLGDVEISRNGWLALTAGGLLTLALGGGLMALVFLSSRRGHDEAHHDQGAFRVPPPCAPARPPRRRESGDSET